MYHQISNDSNLRRQNVMTSKMLDEITRDDVSPCKLSRLEALECFTSDAKLGEAQEPLHKPLQELNLNQSRLFQKLVARTSF